MSENKVPIGVFTIRHVLLLILCTLSCNCERRENNQDNRFGLICHHRCLNNVPQMMSSAHLFTYGNRSTSFPVSACASTCSTIICNLKLDGVNAARPCLSLFHENILISLEHIEMEGGCEQFSSSEPLLIRAGWIDDSAHSPFRESPGEQPGADPLRQLIVHGRFGDERVALEHLLLNRRSNLTVPKRRLPCNTLASRRLRLEPVPATSAY